MTDSLHTESAVAPAEPNSSPDGAPAGPQVLVLDIGGSHVKFLMTGENTRRRFDSGSNMTPDDMVAQVKEATTDWKYDVVAMGYPGPVLHGRPLAEPHHLGCGWVAFRFADAFGCPVKIINDAAMQALGSYRGGKMLFLGLGTGLGSAMISHGRIEPMELGHLPYRKKTFEDYVGERGLVKFGKKKWRHYVVDVVEQLRAALQPQEIVLGGGNVRELKELPPDTRAGSNANAFVGGFRLWNEYADTYSTCRPVASTAAETPASSNQQAASS